jgi:hypothetical protein
MTKCYQHCRCLLPGILVLAAALASSIKSGVIAAELPTNKNDIATEMVENADFEASQLAGWSLVSTNDGNAEIDLEVESPFDASNPHSLKITLKADGSRCSVRNIGTAKMKFDSDTWYDLAFCARTENNKHFGLVVSLESDDGSKICGRATIPEVGGNWKKYALAIHARQSATRGRLVISVFEAGTIWLDFVSLSAREPSQ